MFEYPMHLNNVIMEMFAIEENGAHRRRLWAVVLGLTPHRYQNKWCVSISNKLHETVYAFGDSPEDAMEAFERAMQKKVEVTCDR